MPGPDAIALLKLRYKRLASGLVRHEDPTADVRLFANEAGQLLGLTELRNATAVHTFLPFYGSPDELSVGLGQLLGAKLAAHDDLRGVLVVPDHRLPRAKTYEAFIDAAEADGLWIPIAAPERVQQSIERRTEQVVEFMAQMSALNQAHAAGDDKSVKKARKALAHAFDDAARKTVRTSHPTAGKVRRGGKKALASLQSAFEGVKLDEVQLPSQWQQAADEARAIIQKEVKAARAPKKTGRRLKPPRKRP